MAEREYILGTDAVELERLRNQHQTWIEQAYVLFERAGLRAGQTLLDLGCGPGFTTRLLHEVCAPGELVGLDASESFVALAAASEAPGLVYQVHDVTQMPFPGGAADLIHARLLLAHLREPEMLALRWLGALRPGGRLLLDEVESIASDDPVVARYLELVAGMLRARGQELYVGARLEAATRERRRSANHVRELCLPAVRAAEMFARNLAEFRTQPAIRAQASEAELDALAQDLTARAEGRVGQPVTWVLRQLAIEA